MHALTYFLFYEIFFSEVNLRRHVSCENCIGSVSGGFDPVANQVGLLSYLDSFNLHRPL